MNIAVYPKHRMQKRILTPLAVIGLCGVLCAVAWTLCAFACIRYSAVWIVLLTGNEALYDMFSSLSSATIAHSWLMVSAFAAVFAIFCTLGAQWVRQKSGWIKIAVWSIAVLLFFFGFVMTLLHTRVNFIPLHTVLRILYDLFQEGAFARL